MFRSTKFNPHSNFGVCWKLPWWMNVFSCCPTRKPHTYSTGISKFSVNYLMICLSVPNIKKTTVHYCTIKLDSWAWLSHPKVYCSSTSTVWRGSWVAQGSFLKNIWERACPVKEWEFVPRQVSPKDYYLQHTVF